MLFRSGASGSPGGFFKGGLIGMAGRHITNSAVRTATTQTAAVHTAQKQSATAATHSAMFADNFETLSTDAALRAEQIACRLRHILYASTNVQKEEYLTSAALMMGIDIQYRDGIMEITLPSLLPKRKRWSSSEFLLDPFHAALSQYAREHHMPQFKHCVVFFSNIYNRELPTRRVRDYDNLELKRLLDVAASFMLVDDSGLWCDAYHTTELGETDCTRISIMDSGRFADWLKGREKVLDSIADL